MEGGRQEERKGGKEEKGKKTWIFLLKKDDQIICSHTSKHLYQRHETVYKLFNLPC